MNSTDKDTLPVPFFGLLGSVGLSGDDFDIGTLFWSQARLFGFYHRVLTALSQQREDRPFLEADIESFIIRFRIVLNDVAFVVRQLLPASLRGLKGPKGKRHPKNREVSIFPVASFLEKNSTAYPELANAFSVNATWMHTLKAQRDNVVHYKSKAIVFETKPLSFALLSATGPEKEEATKDGDKRVVAEPIFEFVNSQTFALHNFMHHDLTAVIEGHAKRVGLKHQHESAVPRMTCLGIELFKKENGINV